MKRVNYAHALILDDSSQQVLLVRNGTESSSYWGFPGGGVMEDETLEQAVVREVEEETGLIVKTGRLHSVREVLLKQRGEHALLFTFFANVIKGELSITDPDNEILEIGWKDIETAKELMPYLPEHILSSLGRRRSYYEV